MSPDMREEFERAFGAPAPVPGSKVKTAPPDDAPPEGLVREANIIEKFWHDGGMFMARVEVAFDHYARRWYVKSNLRNGLPPNAHPAAVAKLYAGKFL